MIRSIIPFILANLAITLLAMATYMPLFEWQIDEVVTAFPTTYQVDVPPSPLEARLGESLDDKSFVFRRFDIATDQGTALLEV